MARKYNRRERNVKMVLAVTSSATVASWTIWLDFGWIWKSLSGASAILAVLLQILDLKGTLDAVRRMRTEWHELFFSYRSLWEQIDRTDRPVDSLLDRLLELERRVVRVSENEYLVEVDDQLRRQCQETVLRKHELK